MRSIDFDLIHRFSKALKQEADSWSMQPWSWSEMTEQYQRLHQNPNH
ncbi:MAG: hypothetical protein IJR34_06695 [Bacteroidales bacterium]|nr:hypothetical protein [Bacteroidales bacterium]